MFTMMLAAFHVLTLGESTISKTANSIGGYPVMIKGSLIRQSTGVSTLHYREPPGTFSGHSSVLTASPKGKDSMQ